MRALASLLTAALVLAGPAARGAAHPVPSKTAAPKAGAPKAGAPKTAAKAAAKVGAAKAGAARAGAAKAGAPKEPAVPAVTPVPPEGDVDRERTLRMQAALREILSESALRRTRVGIRVMEARTGRLMFEERGTTLMDPASNQKVLATTTALVRLGADWRYRTELAGPEPDAEGVIDGDVVLRGSGDPTVTSADLATMAIWMARRGARRIDGGVIAEPRRIGSDQAAADDETTADGAPAPDDTGESPQRVSPRAPLVVNHGLMSIRVRPGASAGWPAEVTTAPAGESFVIRNSARTKAGGKTRVSVRLSLSGARIQVEISGKISLGHPAQVFRRRVPQQALYSAVLLRAALEAAGIAVRDPSRVGVTPPPRANRPPLTLLARHESAPLVVLLRRINKDSDNDQAERVLENAGAEVFGGSPTTEKGLRLLREVIGELGLPPASYVPRNGSGLGHANRITADAMADLLRALYLDPRVGPELVQSLSVGGLDGTTRNRFKGTLAARRVRAKTGTLAGKSCLSGLVGDGPDVLAFSILVQGLRGRHSLGAVRGAQVSCVNAMMRYVREAQGQPGAPGAPGAPPPVDIEAGEEVSATEGEATEAEAPTAEDPVDALLRQEQKQAAKAEAEAAGPGAEAPAPRAPGAAPPSVTPKAPPTGGPAAPVKSGPVTPVKSGPVTPVKSGPVTPAKSAPSFR